MPESELDRYKKLIAILRDLASTLDMDTLLNRVVSAAKEISGSTAASIALYDPSEEQFYYHVRKNQDDPGIDFSILLNLVSAKVIANKTTIMINDLINDSEKFGIKPADLGKVRNLVVVPLLSKRELIGVFVAVDRVSGPYSETDVELLEVLAVQSTIAIINSRLFHQSDLMAEFVHEIRTPLTSIGTATYLISRPDMPEEKVKTILVNINNEIKRLNDLATSFLELARLRSGRARYQMSRVDIEQIIDTAFQALQLTADDRGVKLQKVIPSTRSLVSVDRDKITQVLINLISNAIKYNRENGWVTVRFGQDETAWWIEVEDNGVGIPSEAIPRIFQRFYRGRSVEREVTGSGLGLSICSEIVKAHGGKIEVNSLLDQGTFIRCIFPLRMTADQGLSKTFNIPG
ncbi:MAG TPA: GAF domain-containing sensor histidine kinase [Anaerolineales bacterium]|nr:GAF domain-containing sensor histidine kinase [Anaerolineales bacterium]